MLTLLLGDFRSGKSKHLAECIAQDVANGIHAKLIVPEQETVSAELRFSALLPPSAPLTFEVTNFSRLANTVFRAKGGLAGEYADSTSRVLTMWRALRRLAPEMGISALPDRSDVSRFLNAVDEMRASGIGEDALADASLRVRDERLAARMRQLSLVESAHGALLREKYHDAMDDADYLAELLSREPFFSGYHIYIDSFTSFTKQEYAVIRQLILSSDVTVALCLPKDKDTFCYAETKATRECLGKLAKDADVKTKILRTEESAMPPMMAHALSVLRSPVAQEAYRGEGDGSVKLVCARDPFDAADYVAEDIRRRVAAGARYRDFAVVAANAGNYAGILDSALEKNGIPYFYSVAEDLDAFEAVKLIHTACSVILKGWRQSDVISYLKCGLADVAWEDADLFELYVETWKLTGSRFTQKAAWDMNPDGYTDTFTEKGWETLRICNGVKDAFVPPLLELARQTAGELTAKEHAAAIYRFLLALSVPEKLRIRADKEAAEGRVVESGEYARLWETVVHVLDRVCEVLGEEMLTLEAFHQVFSLALSEEKIASIPSSLDEVAIGSAEIFRAGGVDVVYLFGVAEGEFPASVEDNGYFTESQRRLLREAGLSIEPRLVVDASRARFSLLRAMSAGEREAVFVCPKADAALLHLPSSSVAKCLLDTFGEALEFIDTATVPNEERFYSLRAAAEGWYSVKNRAAHRAIRALLSETEEYSDLSHRENVSFLNDQHQISAKTVKRICGDRMGMSQSRLDAYQKCPFSYWCNYGLHLKEERQTEMASNVIGSFVHLLLETFFDLLQKDSLSVKELRQAAVLQYAERAAKICGNAFFPQAERNRARVAYLLEKLEGLARLLIGEMVDEFSQSEFYPVRQELQIGGKGAPDSLKFTLSDGTLLSFGGIIDRVDAMEKNGDVYLRVVDYKTGTKEFKPSDISEGKNLQALLYLAALWKSCSPEFRTALSCRGDFIPAGLEYLAVGGKEAKLDAPLSPEEALAAAKKELQRTGLVMDSEEVLRAMDRELSGRFLPVKRGKDGRFSSANLYSVERLGDLLDEVGTTVLSVGDAIRKGTIKATPGKAQSKDSPCTYCVAKPICRVVEV